MTLGQRIVFLRDEIGLSQKGLAEQIGITPTRLNYWEKDKRQPDNEYLVKIANALFVSTDYLLGNEIILSIDKRIRRCRAQNNMTQQELANKLGLPLSDICDFESGNKKPSSTQHKKLAEVFNNDSLLAFDWDTVIDSSTSISESETMIIEKYRALDDYGARAVTSVLDIEYERCTKEAKDSFNNDK